jgi:hypothetical protein
MHTDAPRHGDPIQSDWRNACVWRAGAAVPLTPKTRAVLTALTAQSGQLVPKAVPGAAGARGGAGGPRPRPRGGPRRAHGRVGRTPSTAGTGRNRHQGRSRASRPKPTRCWPRSTAGAPKVSTQPISKRRRRCSMHLVANIGVHHTLLKRFAQQRRTIHHSHCSTPTLPSARCLSSML